MALRVDCNNDDARDPAALGRWWAELLGWALEVDADGDVVVSPPAGTAAAPLLFFAVPDEKVVKNRLHLDLRPDDHAAEVARAEALGATRVDVGQGEEVTWVVLADPEGNELCILAERPGGS
jgi:hypothetical protein